MEETYLFNAGRVRADPRQRGAPERQREREQRGIRGFGWSGGKRAEGAKVLSMLSPARQRGSCKLVCSLDARAVGHPIEVVAKAIHDLELKRTTGLDGRETRFIQRHDRGACSSPPGYVMNLDQPPPLPPRPSSYSLPSSSPPHPNTPLTAPPVHRLVQTCPPMCAVFT